MPPRPVPFVALLARTAILGGLVGVGALTLLPGDATQAYASPWYLLLRFTQVAALGALALRALAAPAGTFQLPSSPWLLLTAGTTAGVLLSSAASPYRGTSLAAALTPLAALAAFFLVHDWLNRDRARRGPMLLTVLGVSTTAIVAASLGPWLIHFLTVSPEFRGGPRPSSLPATFPFGRSAYVAGAALFALPWLAVLARRARGVRKLLWSAITLAALAALWASSHRGGFLGLAALAIFALVRARPSWKKLAWLGLAAGTAAFALAYAFPRTRVLLRVPAAVSASLQHPSPRQALLTAGTRMGADRPLTGWGPGTTPLVFPRYRADLDRSPDNVAQLHNTPLQLWADGGVLGAAAALGFVLLAVRAARGRADPLADAAVAAVVACGVWALTDYPLDIPFFVLALAVTAAALAPPGRAATAPARRFLIAAPLFALAVIAAGARRDPAPALNIRALALARDPSRTDDAIALLQQSLRLNSDQEVAHFNLGWLLLDRDPAAAESHFLAAARLVPDRAGVYLGLALAESRPSRGDAATRALALELINDPRFLASAWWREPALAARRSDALALAQTFALRVADDLEARRDPRAREGRYLAALIAWLDGRGAPGEILARAQTSARVSYFAARPPIPHFRGGVRRQHLLRANYPRLMRQPDLPAPSDVFESRDRPLAGELAFLFPARGWLPAPRRLALLESPAPPSSATPP